MQFLFPIKKYIYFLFLLFLLHHSLHTNAQRINQPVNNKEWVRKYPGFRVAGNLYYVGTYDLACYLIVTTRGNILINTGLESSLPLIKGNIEDLGFNYNDIKILLTNQAHYDHVGAMADIKAETGALFFADAADVDVLKDGGLSDYEINYLGVSFKPIIPDKLLKNKDIITLGNTKLTFLHHPGHTKGSCSYLMDVADGDKIYQILIANMPSIITEKKFKDVKLYPNIQKD